MSTRRNWDSPNPSPASECALPPDQMVVEGHTRLRLRGWGSSNSDDWRKSLALCLLCDCMVHYTEYHEFKVRIYALQLLVGYV